jgi:di/tricarboxylate transporter
MADSTITFLVLGAAIVVFVSGKVPVAIAALGVAVSLWATGVLELEQALGGFGDPTVVFIATTFVVADALDATGVTAWVGQQLLARAGAGRTRLLVLVMVVCALVTALITPNASVAALIPAAVIIAIRAKRHASQILMPLAFGAHAGALLALTGSPVNVLVADAAHDAGVGRFGFFEFALAGIPLLVGTVVITVVVGPRVLPQRDAEVMPADFSALTAALVRDYELDGTTDVYDRAKGVAEVVIPPRSGLIGQHAFPGMVTESGDLVVLAVQRNGSPVPPGDVVLAAGDALLLRGTWQALDRHLPDDDVLVVDEPGDVRRQVVPLGLGAKESLVVLGAMVGLLATGAVPPAIAGLLAAGALILMGVRTLEQAYRAVSWTTVILVAAMIPLSTAMQSTGAARELADGLVDVVGDAGPYALLVGLFVLVAVLGQLISNTATALIVIPIAVTSAVQLDVSARPVLMAVNVAATAALLTPVATPANMMVMEPGGYRFGDYWKLGLPLLAWYAVVSIGVVPVVWRL